MNSPGRLGLVFTVALVLGALCTAVDAQQPGASNATATPPSAAPTQPPAASPHAEAACRMHVDGRSPASAWSEAEAADVACIPRAEFAADGATVAAALRSANSFCATLHHCCHGLTMAQAAGLTAAAAAGLGPFCAADMPPTAVSGLGCDAVAALPPESAAALSHDQLHGIKPGCVAAMTKRQAGKMFSGAVDDQRRADLCSFFAPAAATLPTDVELFVYHACVSEAPRAMLDAAAVDAMLARLCRKCDLNRMLPGCTVAGIAPDPSCAGRPQSPQPPAPAPPAGAPPGSQQWGVPPTPPPAGGSGWGRQPATNGWGRSSAAPGSWGGGTGSRGAEAADGNAVTTGQTSTNTTNALFGGTGSAFILFLVAMGLVGYALHVQRSRNRNDWSTANTPAHGNDGGFPHTAPSRRRRGKRDKQLPHGGGSTGSFAASGGAQNYGGGGYHEGTVLVRGYGELESDT